VTILRDVARALAYAHAQGVVHRDIKPENVLLHDDSALVTDFGIAKALAASAATTAQGAGNTPITPAPTLTGLGIWLGTPAYMAPEQAAGESVDSRADLYAWGMMAYELLAGRHPFASKSTPAQLIAAQIGETPTPLGSVVRDAPPALASLVMRCLTKEPAGRPDSADEIVSELRTWIGTREPASVDRRGRRPWPWIATAAGAVAAISLAAWAFTPPEARVTLRTLVTRPPATLRVNRVVVAPFKDETGDARLAALGALAADYITEGLSRLGSLQVVDTRTATQSGDFLSRIPRILRPNDDRALGQETGAKVVIAGTYYLLGDSVVLRARALDAETGAVRTALEPAVAPARQPTSAVAAMTARVVAAMRAASDEDAPDLAGLSPPPSLAAYAAFHEAYQAYIRTSPESVVAPGLMRAMSLDSTYAAPAVLLAFISPTRLIGRGGETAMDHARRFGDRLTKQEQALLDLAAATDNNDGAAALEAAQRTGVPILIASQALLVRRPRTAVAALASTDSDRGMNIPLAAAYWSRLSQAYAQLGDYDRAWAALIEGRRRAPSLQTNIMLEVSILGARGDVQALSNKLDAIWDSGDRGVGPAIQGTALLRMRAGKEKEGRALASLWADRFTRADATKPLPARNEIAMVDLLASVGRWAESRRFVDAAKRSTGDAMSGIDESHVRLRSAVTAIHLGNIAEAIAIDSAFAQLEPRRLDGSHFTMARAVIAAHLGRTDDAITLLTKGIERGGLSFFGAGDAGNIGTLHDVILLQPLLADPRFRALADPDPRDRP
jgi:TolB-like protein/tetratricopeptide (TPR) repeat protein